MSNGRMRVAIITGSTPWEKMGGAEYQSYLLAKGLVERGHRVTFIAARAKAKNESNIEAIDFRSVPNRNLVGRNEHIDLLHEAIQASQPQLCYVRVFGEIASVASSCKYLDIPMISASVHQKETSPFLLGYHAMETLDYFRSGKSINHIRSFLAINLAKAHVCNTNHLTKRIRRWYPRKTVSTIYNGSPPPAVVETNGSGRDVIWVNNIRRWKRPEIFIDLAHSLPAYRFVMVGRMSGSRSYARRLKRLIAKAPSNFEYLGGLPLKSANERIGHSSLLLYTSLPVEGFANSFLQAWVRGVPTLSLDFDLDGILEREGIGHCSSSFNELVSQVDQLMKDDDARKAMGQRAFEFAVANHSADIMVERYEDLMHEVLRQEAQVLAI